MKVWLLYVDFTDIESNSIIVDQKFNDNKKLLLSRLNTQNDIIRKNKTMDTNVVDGRISNMSNIHQNYSKV